ncbi:MAG: uroporphyrinogen decarboxylase family protein [Oceanipulchritudo sp.]
MEREFYLNLARERMAMPIGADLLLSSRPDPEAIRLRGPQLGEVIVEAARKYRTPLAFPLMDLQIEKEFLLTSLGVEEAAISSFHFDEDGPDDGSRTAIREKLETFPPTAKMQAAMEAIRHVAEQADLVPMGMSIGPFSLLTKLVDDPITTIYMASHEEEGEDEHDIVHGILDIATRVISRWIQLQIDSGAKAICVCEPAANTIYLSPNQLESDPEIFDRMVIDYNKRIADRMAEQGVDLVFHDCGELIPVMIEKFQQLDPAILSLGSPVPLWEAARHTKRDTVLFGNLPSKKFYSDKEYPESRLKEEARHLREKMDATGHPYILGSECDVLAVNGCECTIRRKTELLLEC